MPATHGTCRRSRTLSDRTKSFAALPSAMGLLWRVDKASMTFLILANVILGLFPVLQLLLLRASINTFVAYLALPEKGVLRSLIILLAGQVAISVAFVVVRLTADRSRVLFGMCIANHISLLVYRHADAAQLTAFDDSHFYDLMQRATKEAGTRPVELLSQLLVACRSVIAMIGYMATLTAVSSWLPFWLMIVVLPSFVVQRHFARSTYLLTRSFTSLQRKRAYFSYLLQSDWLIGDVKLFGLGTFLLGKFTAAFHAMYAETARLHNRILRSGILAQLGTGLTVMGALTYVALASIALKVGAGVFAMYLGAVVQFAGTAAILATSASGVYGQALFFSNLFEFLHMDVTPPIRSMQWKDTIREVELVHVSFLYRGRALPSVRDVSLTLRTGEFVAIVGGNGSGKSTIAKLLLGLYEPTGGSMSINGVDSKDVSPSCLRQRMSAIFQNVAHLELTVRENIAVGDVGNPMDTDTIERSAVCAGLQEIIAGMPFGLDTQLGTWFEHGVQLSPGQWQRLVFARALVRNADVLVVDEPTSMMDRDAEGHVLAELKRYSADHIVVIVTHSLSAARLADRVIVMRDGAIVGQGTHSELWHHNDCYSKLFATRGASLDA